MGGGAFPSADHLLALREERRDGQKIRDDVNKFTLKGLVRDINATDLRLILHAKITVA